MEVEIRFKSYSYESQESFLEWISPSVRRVREGCALEPNFFIDSTGRKYIKISRGAESILIDLLEILRVKLTVTSHVHAPFVYGYDE